MSGYSEDGMSIGVGVGQLAPWMMPPDDYQPLGPALSHQTNHMPTQEQMLIQRHGSQLMDGHHVVDSRVMYDQASRTNQVLLFMEQDAR